MSTLTRRNSRNAAVPKDRTATSVPYSELYPTPYEWLRWYHDTSWTVRGGWRFSPYAAVELGYYDFGRYNFDGNVIGHVGNVNGSGKAHSVALSLVGIIPISNFDLYGRIGYAHSELKFNASGPLGGIANENNRQDEATYGAGVRWNFHPQWGVFAEWIKNDRIRIDSYVAGIDYRF